MRENLIDEPAVAQVTLHFEKNLSFSSKNSFQYKLCTNLSKNKLRNVQIRLRRTKKKKKYMYVSI